MRNINDLNLEYLRTLNSIIQSKSVTKSANELGVTQSAMSHTLKKLRDQLEDELVFRQGNQLELTAKAKAIKAPLAKWLREIESILEVEDFVPLTSQKVFLIATSDIVEQLFMPRLIQILSREAPLVQVRAIKWEYPKVEGQLLNSEVDFAIGVRGFDSSALMKRELYSESFVSMARKRHPIFRRKINIENFLKYPHVMAGPGDGRGAIDNYLDKINRKRNLMYTVHSFSSAPALVESTDCLLTAPKRFLEHTNGKYDTRLFETPVEMNSFGVNLYWAKLNHQEAANSWMREKIYAIAKTL